MRCIWQGNLREDWDSMQLCCIIERLRYWTLRHFRPWVSSCLDQWCLKHNITGLSYGRDTEVDEEEDDLSSKDEGSEEEDDDESDEEDDDKSDEEEDNESEEEEDDETEKKRNNESEQEEDDEMEKKEKEKQKEEGKREVNKAKPRSASRDPENRGVRKSSLNDSSDKGHSKKSYLDSPTPAHHRSIFGSVFGSSRTAAPLTSLEAEELEFHNARSDSNASKASLAPFESTSSSKKMPMTPSSTRTPKVVLPSSFKSTSVIPFRNKSNSSETESGDTAFSNPFALIGKDLHAGHSFDFSSNPSR